MPEARESFTNAVATIEAMGDDASHYRDAIERYALADATAAIVRSAWEDEGRPMLRSGSGPARAHPLLKALQDAEVQAGVRLGAVARSRREGEGGTRRMA
jgi:hypothetical protein